MRQAPTPAGAAVRARTVPTIGVEEEFLLIDPHSRQLAPKGPEVCATLASATPHAEPEMHAAQLELVTGVCHNLDELRGQLTSGRQRFARAAEENGCRLVAVGMPPVESPPVFTPKDRYAYVQETYRSVAHTSCVGGTHIHVGVDGLDDALHACNRMRPWLPTLLALFSNSPVHNGTDTGYASWRTIAWSRWPTTGPPPHLPDAAAYHATVEQLVHCAAGLDDGMLYWYARPSAKWPTIELRIADVSLTVDEELLLTALCRGLVHTALHHEPHPPATPPVPNEVLRASCWRAARYGLTGQLPHGITGRLVPAWQAVDALIAHIRPALLDAGDLPFVEQATGWLRTHGNGAQRLREVYQRSGGDAADVVDYAIQATKGAASCLPPLSRPPGWARRRARPRPSGGETDRQ
ncbi:glutamate--cysteine ligase [Streptomyces sp. NPDC093707]|uniref:carboxylate-amine ligase n=1 Tax=Streptomyces sp. NPDC093707 TaxID=3154984 RepID=UPI00344EA6FF